MRTIVITCDACGDVVGAGAQTVGARDVCGVCFRTMKRVLVTPEKWQPHKAEQISIDQVEADRIAAKDAARVEALRLEADRIARETAEKIAEELK